MLSEEEKEEIGIILKRRSRFVWSEKAIKSTIKLLETIKAGKIKLSDPLPGTNMTHEDYLFERDLLKFVKQ